MLRAFLCSAALFSLATVSLAANKAVEKTNKNENEVRATVTKVDAHKNTITVTMKDKNGKEEQKTITLTNDVKVVGANDKAITLDSIKAGDEVTLTRRNGKLVEVDRENGPATAKGRGHKHEATITKVDAKNGTVTVRMKDKNGKEVQRTFTLTGESRYFDSNGRVAAADVFQSGNDVLVVEEQGRVVRMQQKGKTSDQNKNNKK